MKSFVCAYQSALLLSSVLAGGRSPPRNDRRQLYESDNVFGGSSYLSLGNVLDDLSMNGSHPILQTSVKQYFATSPPMARCDQGLLGVMMRSLQLLPEQVYPLLAFQGKNDVVIHTDVYDVGGASSGSILEKRYSAILTNIIDQFGSLFDGPSNEVLTSSNDHEEDKSTTTNELSAAKKLRTVNFNPTALINQYGGIVKNFRNAQNMIIEPMAYKLLIESARREIKKSKNEILSSGDLSESDTRFISDQMDKIARDLPSSLAHNKLQEKALRFLTESSEQLLTSQPFGDGSTTDAETTEAAAPGLLKLIPEVLLGWTSSRVTSRFLESIIGAITVYAYVDVTKSDSLGLPKPNVTLDVSLYIANPGTNFGDGACDAADYSFAYDADLTVWATCALMDAVAFSLTCGGSKPPVPDCTNNQAKWEVPGDGIDKNGEPDTTNICFAPDGSQYAYGPDDNKTSIDLTLEPSFTLDSHNTEGYQYYFMYRGIILASSYTNTDAFCDKTNTMPKQLVPGWKTVLEVRAQEDGDPLFAATRQEDFPIVLVSQQMILDDPANPIPTCNFLVTERGTSSSFEWLQDFSFALVPSIEGNFTVHDGFSRIVYSYSPMLDAFFDEILASGKCECADGDKKLSITVAGHSLGGGTGELTTLHLGTRYGPDNCKANIQGVFFAPVHALSQVAADRLSAVANVRSLVYELDFVPKFPCAQLNPSKSAKAGSGLPRCDARMNLITIGDTTSRDYYGQHVNELIIPLDDLVARYAGYGNKDFGAVDIRLTLDLKDKIVTSSVGKNMHTPAPLELMANHVCAYACWTAANYCGLNWMCTNCPLLK